MLKKLLLRYEFLCGFGLLIAILSLANVVGYTSIDSDLFWMFAGLGLAIESSMELYFEWKSPDNFPSDEWIAEERQDSLADELLEEPK